MGMIHKQILVLLVLLAKKPEISYSKTELALVLLGDFKCTAKLKFNLNADSASIIKSNVGAGCLSK